MLYQSTKTSHKINGFWHIVRRRNHYTYKNCALKMLTKLFLCIHSACVWYYVNRYSSTFAVKYTVHMSLWYETTKWLSLYLYISVVQCTKTQPKPSELPLWLVCFIIFCLCRTHNCIAITMRVNDIEKAWASVSPQHVDEITVSYYGWISSNHWKYIIDTWA